MIKPKHICIYTLLTIGIISCKNNPTQKPLTNNIPKVHTTPYLKPDTYTCYFTNVSTAYNFKLQRIYYQGDSMWHDSSIVRLDIYKKRNNTLHQSIQFISNELYSDLFKNCDSSKHILDTKHTKHIEPEDASYEFVIGDFNFDGKEDIAIISATPNSGGCYNFYIQNSKNEFVIDTFLSDTMTYFPTEYNYAQKRLTTFVPLGVAEVSKKTYQYNSIKHTWSTISHTFLHN